VEKYWLFNKALFTFQTVNKKVQAEQKRVLVKSSFDKVSFLSFSLSFPLSRLCLYVLLIKNRLFSRLKWLALIVRWEFTCNAVAKWQYRHTEHTHTAVYSVMTPTNNINNYCQSLCHSLDKLLFQLTNCSNMK